MIADKDIDHLSELSRLGIGPQEKRSLAKDLERILQYVGELSGVDTSDVAPMTGGTELANIVRGDGERTDSFKDKDALSELAPARKEKYFKVPRILD